MPDLRQMSIQNANLITNQITSVTMAALAHVIYSMAHHQPRARYNGCRKKKLSKHHQASKKHHASSWPSGVTVA
jgi:hypothetical protein